MKLFERITEALAKISPRVEDELVEAAVTREVNKRKEAISKVMDALENIRREIRRVKPDVNTYDLEGKVVSTGYTKAGLDALNKFKENEAKHIKALTQALEEGKMDLVYNLAKGGGKDSEGGQ